MNDPESLASVRAAPQLLFAYGTLALARKGAEAERWVVDWVRGRLYDLGPFPVLIDWNDPQADWVEGYVRQVDQRELEEQLDFYEGVDEGLYRRVSVATKCGRTVWVYVYLHPLPDTARGPLQRWDGPRADSQP